VLYCNFKKIGDYKYQARTWDVEYLKKKKKWKIIVNTPEQVEEILGRYQKLSRGYLNEFENYKPNTIVIWHGLYKFENYLDESEKINELKKEITEVTSEYLSLVFHRFLEKEKDALNIRVNNNVIVPFNPFPTTQPDFRKQESSRKKFQSENLTIQGYILPARSLDESKNGNTIWTQSSKSLTDMEGMYIYRSNRIILFGGWNGIIKKSPKLQLARLKVDIGNSVDKYFHLNVAKSSIIIPPSLRIAFLRYINELKSQAQKEYYNRGIKTISTTSENIKGHLFKRTPSSKGMLLEINEAFFLVENLYATSKSEQVKILRIIFRMINTTINKIRQVHEDENFNVMEEKISITVNELSLIINKLKQNGIASEDIRNGFLPALGFRQDLISKEIDKLLTD
jgi:hypothetical protein